jgi:hypothetical protein
VTVLVGGERGKAMWEHWLERMGIGGTLLEGDFEERIRDAVAVALDQPLHPVAVLVSAEAAARWRTGRRDRLAALVDEGWIVVDGGAADGAMAAAGEALGGAAASRLGGEQRGAPGLPANGRRPAVAADAGIDARSLAEAALFEALEATPATAGRFSLNESLSVRFGPRAAEIDLLARGDRIAIEIDGAHHFDDLECYRRDRRKDLQLQTQGFVVVRLLAEDVMRDVQSAVNAVCQALAYRQAERGR